MSSELEIKKAVADAAEKKLEELIDKHAALAAVDRTIEKEIKQVYVDVLREM
jgi:hypothetical protein